MPFGAFVASIASPISNRPPEPPSQDPAIPKSLMLDVSGPPQINQTHLQHFQDLLPGALPVLERLASAMQPPAVQLSAEARAARISNAA